MPKRIPAKILNDEPAEAGGHFYFPQYAKTISDIIAYKDNKTPLTIGIYGSWGTGKTSLMRLIEKNLREYNSGENFRSCKTVWFQAWKYADEEKILAALIEEIFKAMEQDSFFQNIKGNIEKITKSARPHKLLSKLSNLITAGNFDVTEFFGGLEYKEKLSFFHTFDKFFSDLIYCYVTKTGMNVTGSDEVNDEKGVLVIFIDDLDRCPKDRILNVLESIKLFLDKECCVFVIGADREIITCALKESYPQGADKFLEKIVQLSFVLPKMDDALGQKYLDSLKEDSVLKNIAPLLITSLSHNPRRIKRLINDYNFMNDLAANRYSKNENPIESENLLRWLIIETIYPNFARLVKEKSLAYIGEIKKHIKALEEKMKETDKSAWFVNDEKIKEISAIDMAEYLKDRNFIEIIKDFPSEVEKIKPYISFTASVVVEEKENLSLEKGDRFDKYSGVIKGGKFKLGETGEEAVIEKDFEMGIYPVTNSQYKRFIDAGGYENYGYWSDEGKKWRKGDNIIMPVYWGDEKWNKPDYPIVGVSWYEAEAYCKWLSKYTGQDYRLPTAAEWEKAASWDEANNKKRVYPWGDEFDKDKCNTDESRIGQTTPVDRYPQGRSPYGCYDMAGNVWEWTDSYKDEKYKVFCAAARGLSGADYCRCADRDRVRPCNRSIFVGFRCARTLKL